MSNSLPWSTSTGSTTAACTASWACSRLPSSKPAWRVRLPHRYWPQTNDPSLHETRGGSGCYYAGGDRPFHTNRDHGGGAEHRLLRSIYRCANHARDLAAASGPDPAFVARGGAILLSLADGKLCPARCMAPAFR